VSLVSLSARPRPAWATSFHWIARADGQHAALVTALGRWLIDSVGQKAIVAVQDPIHLDDSSEPQPDITLLKPRVDYYAAAHPGPADTLLIVEVAESSLAYDLPGRRDGRRLQRLAQVCAFRSR